MKVVVCIGRDRSCGYCYPCRWLHPRFLTCLCPLSLSVHLSFHPDTPYLFPPSLFCLWGRFICGCVQHLDCTRCAQDPACRWSLLQGTCVEVQGRRAGAGASPLEG